MAAKLNRATRCTAAVLAAVALGAGVTACSGTSSATASKPNGSTAASATAGASQTPTSAGTGASAGSGTGTSAGTGGTTTLSSTSNGGSGSSGGSTQGGSSTGTTGGSGSAVTSRCHTSDLTFAWGTGSPDMKATNQQIAQVVLTNRSRRTCTLHGFPGVRLISTSGEAWDLPRSSDTPSTMTLHPGESTASILITVLPVPANTTDTRPFAPAKVLITPPDETTHVTLNWPYGGAVWHQAGTPSHPETFVSPVGV